MSEYTPHTEIVRARYHLATIGDDTPDFIIEMGQSRNYAEFDRWLRKVQAEAWFEGADAAVHGYELPDASDIQNPYLHST